MDNEVKLSGSEDKDEKGVKSEEPASNESKSETGAKPEKKPSKRGVKSGKRADEDVKTKKRTGKRKKSIGPEVWGVIAQVAVAIIGVIGAFAIALLNFQPLIQWLQPSPTPTFTSVLSSTPFIAHTFAPVSTDTPMSTPTQTPTSTPTDTPTATSTELPTSTPANEMVVIMTASKNTGKPSLNVKFDARDSYLREPSGRQLPCRGGPCFYTWRVYSGGNQIGISNNNTSGTFDYIFGKSGSYRVTVHICRGKDRIDCGDSGVLIEVTR